jgi:hypothetical protein
MKVKPVSFLANMKDKQLVHDTQKVYFVSDTQKENLSRLVNQKEYTFLEHLKLLNVTAFKTQIAEKLKNIKRQRQR